MSLLSCGCCSNAQQYIAEHIDPSGTIEAHDRPEVIMERIAEMYADTPGGHPVTLVDVQSYLRGIGSEAIWPAIPGPRIVETDWVCPECFANVRCDCE